MPSEQGEIQIDRADLVEDAALVARTLDHRGTANLHYGAYGTGWRMLAIDQRTVQRDDKWLDEPTRTMITGEVHGRGIQGIGRGTDEYTLWLRDTGNDMRGPWLTRRRLHVPDYLAGKYGCNTIDGFSIGLLIALVDCQRRPASEDDLQATLRTWDECWNRMGLGEGHDAPPIFHMIKTPDQGGHDE